MDGGREKRNKKESCRWKTIGVKRERKAGEDEEEESVRKDGSEIKE